MLHFQLWVHHPLFCITTKELADGLTRGLIFILYIYTYTIRNGYKPILSCLEVEKLFCEPFFIL